MQTSTCVIVEFSHDVRYRNGRKPQIPYSRESLQGGIFANHTISLSEEIFTTFWYYVCNKRCIEDMYIGSKNVYYL